VRKVYRSFVGHCEQRLRNAETKQQLLFHTLAVAPIVESNTLRGAIFDGHHAVLAKGAGGSVPVPRPRFPLRLKAVKKANAEDCA
jgi:hypothetical protein